MKKTIFSIFLIFCVRVVFSQQVISTAGSAISDNDTQLSWTLGEVVIETAISDSNIVAQGFHKSCAINSLVNNDEIVFLESNDVIVFPNPVDSQLKIKLNDVIANKYSFFIADVFGRMIYEGRINKNLQTIDMNNFTKGLYVLKIENLYRNNCQTFKIIKK